MKWHSESLPRGIVNARDLGDMDQNAAYLNRVPRLPAAGSVAFVVQFAGDAFQGHAFRPALHNRRRQVRVSVGRGLGPRL